MAKSTPIRQTVRIVVINLTPIEPEVPPPDSLWCVWCWKWHPNTTIGRYDKNGSWSCSECVLDCYVFGNLIGRTWRQTKTHWGFRKTQPAASADDANGGGE